MAGYYLTPELAKEADDIAREQYKSHIHPATERVETDEEGEKIFYQRDPDSPATLWMVQYYYHMGNLYKDTIDTKATIAIICAAVSALISIVCLTILLI